MGCHPVLRHDYIAMDSSVHNGFCKKYVDVSAGPGLPFHMGSGEVDVSAGLGLPFHMGGGEVDVSAGLGLPFHTGP